MPTNVLHAGCVTELAGDTTTARSYHTSFAERERLHLRQESGVLSRTTRIQT
jgi:hypothetical protein